MDNESANTGKILIYQNEKGETKIDVYFTEDTIWMTQRTMAGLSSARRSLAYCPLSTPRLRLSVPDCGL